MSCINIGDGCCVSALQPGEAVGNVGQLAVDLLIVRHSLTCIGYLETAFVQPCAGLNAYDGSGKVHLAMELYAGADTGVVVLQQRAPVLRGCQAQFAAQLADWLQSSGFSQAHTIHSMMLMLELESRHQCLCSS
jgi:proteasome assembly chaperone 2